MLFLRVVMAAQGQQTALLAAALIMLVAGAEAITAGQVVQAARVVVVQGQVQAPVFQVRLILAAVVEVRLTDQVRQVERAGRASLLFPILTLRNEAPAVQLQVTSAALQQFGCIVLPLAALIPHDKHQKLRRCRSCFN
jgi:hypothetical protein